MSKKIAVYLNDVGETSSLNEEGTVKVYIKKNEQWEVVEAIEFNIGAVVGIQGIREKYKGLVQALGECKILVGSSITGISYNVLDSMGLNLWEMEGKPEDFLEYVLENEIKDENSKGGEDEGNKKVVTLVETDKEGYYFINLKELQESNGKVTSKQALLPFLRSRIFYELEILCSHMPTWFEKEFEALNLKYFVVQSSSNEYKVRVYHKTCSE